MYLKSIKSRLPKHLAKFTAFNFEVKVVCCAVDDDSKAETVHRLI